MVYLLFLLDMYRSASATSASGTTGMLEMSNPACVTTGAGVVMLMEPGGGTGCPVETMGAETFACTA
jgi:hypothetical protein